MRPIVIFLTFMLSFTCCACTPSDDGGDPGTPQQPGNNGNGTNPGNNGNMKIKITIGNTVFTATLEDNAAASAFAELLPLTLDMGDVNRNEKYARLGSNLPTSVYAPGTIRTGDLMLWGSDGVVLFYKTFSSSYSYTRLGALDDPSNLETVVGTGSVTVKFELINK